MRASLALPCATIYTIVELPSVVICTLVDGGKNFPVAPGAGHGIFKIGGIGEMFAVIDCHAACVTCQSCREHCCVGICTVHSCMGVGSCVVIHPFAQRAQVACVIIVVVGIFACV